ncbi:late secretory pathway protein AVL9 homolog [Homalodisca vitripennis]|nr:late secretory pathway protein AVL9 homolog [Homalodisca vitripennis]
MEEDTNLAKNKPILHVLVIGFHHKKGCQVEYSYPPLVPGGEGGESECPRGWKYLPTLALPDGSHNFDEDTVYFHLPSLTDPDQTVFGISCFRQIPVEKIKNRTADITRGTVQKSVCVLSSIPLYGHIQVKMALITHAYFEEGDFTKVKLLKDTYHHLNDCLLQIQDIQSAPQLFVGLSARELILQFRHKALLLFKLLLLERRVVFYRSPVQPLCAAILSLLSLHPGMIEKGLYHCACVRPSRPMSPVPQYTTEPVETETSRTHQEKNDVTLPEERKDIILPEERKEPDKDRDKQEVEIFVPNVSIVVSDDTVVNGVDLCERVDCEDAVTPSDRVVNGDKTPSDISQNETPHLPRDTSMDTLGEMTMVNNLAAIAQIDAEACGCPLQVFVDGYLCLPYLSLPYMDVLSDPNVRGYFVGATNVLFKQKKRIAEVLVEVETGRVETGDMELRRLLHLSTEDLRFADFLVRHVAEERHDVFVDGVGWEGGDEWIRAQFRAYLLCLLRTSLLQEGSRELDHFNASFVSAWRHTHNYTTWVDGSGRDAVLEINPGHPFAGQLSVADMKLRLAHTMQNTEGGRKLNQAMVSTGRAVVTTGRAVGGAISHAKGALSNWWSNLTTVQSPTEAAEPAAEVVPAEITAIEA